MAKKLEVQFAVIDKATSELNKISREFNGLSERINKFGMAARNIFAGAATLGAVEGLRRMVTAGIEYGGMIDDMSKRTGMSVEQVQKLDFIAKQCGSSFESLSRAVLKLQVSASQAQSGNDKMAAAFKTLGVNVKDTDGLLENTLISISKIENPTRRAAAAQAVFGKGAGEMLQIIGQGEPTIRQMIDNYKLIGGPLSSDMIAKLDETGDKIAAAQYAFTRLSGTLAAELAPAIQKAAEFWSQFMSDLKKPEEVKVIDKLNQNLARFQDELNQSKLRMFEMNAPGYKGNFLEWAFGIKGELKGQISNLEKQIAETKKRIAENAPQKKIFVGPPVPSARVNDVDIEKAQAQALERARKAREKDQEEQRKAHALNEKFAKALIDQRKEREQQDLEDGKMVLEQKIEAAEQYLQIRQEQARREIETQEKIKAVETAKYEATKEMTLAGIQQMGEATQMMASNARERKMLALIETVAYGGVSSALAWKEAFASSDTGEFWGKLAAAVIGTGAAVANTVVALATINKYASGGIVPGTGSGDTVPAMLTPGEAVFNRRQQAQLFQMVNGGGSTTNDNRAVNVHIHEGGNVESIRAAIRSGGADRFLADLFSRGRRLGFA